MKNTHQLDVLHYGMDSEGWWKPTGRVQEWRILTSRMSCITVWTVMDGGNPLEEFKSGEY